MNGYSDFEDKVAYNLVKELQSMNVKVILLEHAAHLDHRDRQPQIHDIFKTLADNTGIVLAPVGSLIWSMKEINPSTDFHRWDKSHPNQKGSYIAALMIYTLITGNNSKAPPFYYDYTYKGMNAENELFLRKAVHNFFSST